MQSALPLVASLFPSCPGDYGPLSMPGADRLHPDSAGAAPLPPSRVPVGIAAVPDSALRPTASGNLDYSTAAHGTVPRRRQAVGTPGQPPGLPLFTVPAGASQEQSHTLRGGGVGLPSQRRDGRSGEEQWHQERRACF